MSILQNRPARAKPRKQRFFGIRFEIEGDSYAVSRLPADPSVARCAFRLRKLTAEEPTSYDIRLTEHGLECECLGFLRYGRCRHCDTLRVAAGVFDLTAPPQPKVQLPRNLEAEFA
jgi:hypothetical protein